MPLFFGAEHRDGHVSGVNLRLLPAARSQPLENPKKHGGISRQRPEILYFGAKSKSSALVHIPHSGRGP
jgi:hypothetical protein